MFRANREKQHLPLESETAFFLLVGVLDIFLTHMLLVRGGFREGNPVAEFFLNHWGPRGMVYFKCGVMAVVCVTAQLIARQRLDTARRVLQLGTLVTGGVVIYSVTLLIRAGGM